MHSLSQLRLQLLTLVEDIGTASMHLREAEGLNEQAARPSLEDASACIAELSADLAILDAALQRHLNP